MLSVETKFKKQEYSLGEAIPVTVMYTNAGSVEVEIDDPATSLNTEMHVFDWKNQEDLYYTIGTIEVTQLDDAKDEFAIVEPIPDKITINSNEDYSFITDIHQRLYLRPGDYECEYRDGAIISKQQKILIRYTIESVDLLYNIAKDPAQGYSRREWAVDWLQAFAPNFNITLTLDTDPETTMQQNEAGNQRIYDAFNTWWQKNKASKAVVENIKAINAAPPR